MQTHYEKMVKIDVVFESSFKNDMSQGHTTSYTYVITLYRNSVLKTFIGESIILTILKEQVYLYLVLVVQNGFLMLSFY